MDAVEASDEQFGEARVPLLCPGCHSTWAYGTRICVVCGWYPGLPRGKGMSHMQLSGELATGAPKGQSKDGKGKGKGKKGGKGGKMTKGDENGMGMKFQKIS